jgi:hypothetical protein
MHALHSIPPNGLSGLFCVFGILCSCFALSRATPVSTLPHWAHFALLGFLFLNCKDTFAPGVLLYTLLLDLDLLLGFTILSRSLSFLLLLAEKRLIYKCLARVGSVPSQGQHPV